MVQIGFARSLNFTDCEAAVHKELHHALLYFIIRAYQQFCTIPSRSTSLHTEKLKQQISRTFQM